MKIKLKNILNFMIFLIIIILVFVYVYSILELKILRDEFDMFVLLTFVLNAFICLIELTKDKMPYSLNKSFWLFNLFFLFLAPLINYITNYSQWGYSLSSDYYLKSNLIILLFYVSYVFFRHSKKKKFRNIKIEDDDFDNNDGYVNRKTVIFCFFLSIIAFILMIKFVGGFGNLFYRGRSDVAFDTEGFVNALIQSFCTSIPVYSLMLFYKNKEKKFTSILCMIVLFFIIVCLNFPTSTTRFYIGAIYIGLFLVIFKKILSNRLYDFMIIVTFAFLFPLMFSFKYVSIDNFSLNELMKNYNFLETYNSVDYDAYSILSRSIKYVHDNDYTYGKQISGTILFFVPRVIWQSKPNNSGALIVSSQNQRYTNVSCPLIAEGFIDFGLPGVLLYGFIISRLFAYLDYDYWYSKEKVFRKIEYPFMMGFTFFIMRGSLHSSLIYTLYFLMTGLFIFVINKIIERKLFK